MLESIFHSRAEFKRVAGCATTAGLTLRQRSGNFQMRSAFPPRMSPARYRTPAPASPGSLPPDVVATGRPRRGGLAPRRSDIGSGSCHPRGYRLRYIVLSGCRSLSRAFCARWRCCAPLRRLLHLWAHTPPPNADIGPFNLVKRSRNRLKDSWVRTSVDGFILAGLHKGGFKAAPEADRATLVRRITYDLTGLPPTPAEIDAFVSDRSTDAWAKVVDRLLASPHYGEQWGRHWLDVVRFAESDGYEYDMHRPDAYRYRDYVVESFNQDKPYDAFVREQLAGDEIDPIEPDISGRQRLQSARPTAIVTTVRHEDSLRKGSELDRCVPD